MSNLASISEVTPVLEDVVQPGLKLVIVGTAAGHASAARRAYYAGAANRFWKVLAEVGLTPSQFSPADYRGLLAHGIGLTDLAKYASGSDSELKPSDFDVGGFQRKIANAAPKILAFNGKKPASLVIGRQTQALAYGAQREMLGDSMVFVLPSTSGAAAGSWSIAPWQELAVTFRRIPEGRRS